MDPKGPTDAQRAPRVLLAPYTGSKDVVEHFRVLHFEHNFDVDLKLGAMPHGEYDLIIQMGLGPDPERIKGLSYVRILRNAFPKTPILVVSGHDPSYALEEVRRYGADDFVQKNAPHEMELFMERVRALLTRKTAPSE